MYEHKKNLSINLMCKVFKVERSYYYHWIAAGYVIKKEDNQQLTIKLQMKFNLTGKFSKFFRIVPR